MKTQSNVRPQLLEKYADIWRINFDVSENNQGDGTPSYDYEMVELPARGYTRAELISALISVRYSTDAQIAMLANDSHTSEHSEEYEQFQAYRILCKNVATQIMGAQ